MKPRYKVDVSFTPDAKAMMLYERIGELVNGKAPVERMMRVALAETVVRIIAKRFLAGLPEALRMVSATSLGKLNRVVAPSNDLRESIADQVGAVARARNQGDAGSIELAEARLRRKMDHYQSALLGQSGHKADSSFGQMLKRAMQVFEYMTETEVGRSTTDMKVVGIGNLQKLEGVETPTANRSGQTTSSMNVLWRHLEFGTGLYAADPSVNPRDTFKVPGGKGMWWWGRKKKRKWIGAQIVGSSGIYALNLGKDFENSEEAKQFSKKVVEVLTQYLTG